MKYTNENEQIVFLRDADIARTIDGKTISSNTIIANGVPSFDLFKERYEELSTYDNNICAYLKNQVEVSTSNLCVELRELRIETTQLSNDICLSVNEISSFIENVISVDLYNLSDELHETSTILSNEVQSLLDDVRGHVNYKGHISADNTLKYNDKNFEISALLAHHYHVLGSDHKLSTEKILNNGWLYNFTTKDKFGYKPLDLEKTLENNDYLIIHNHKLSSTSISNITNEDVDIIEALQEDYVREALLDQISTFLSNDLLSNDQEHSGENWFYGKTTFGMPVYVDSELTVVNPITAKNGISANSQVVIDKPAVPGSLENNTIKLTYSKIKKIDDVNEYTYEYPERSGTIAITQDVQDLSDSLSTTTRLSVEELQRQIISNDIDLSNLSDDLSIKYAACAKLSIANEFIAENTFKTNVNINKLSVFEETADNLVVDMLSVKNKLSVATEVDFLSSSFTVKEDLVRTVSKVEIANDLNVSNNISIEKDLFVNENVAINKNLSVVNCLTAIENEHTVEIENAKITDVLTADFSRIIDNADSRYLSSYYLYLTDENKVLEIAVLINDIIDTAGLAGIENIDITTHSVRDVKDRTEKICERARIKARTDTLHDICTSLNETLNIFKVKGTSLEIRLATMKHAIDTNERYMLNVEKYLSADVDFLSDDRRSLNISDLDIKPCNGIASSKELLSIF